MIFILLKFFYAIAKIEVEKKTNYAIIIYYPTKVGGIRIDSNTKRKFTFNILRQ